MDLTFKIVRRLLRDDEVGFSRNQNFEAYEDPKVKRAVRIYRHLSSVEDDLLGLGGEVDLDAVERNEGRVVIKLSFAEGSGRRVSFLTPREWGLLLENERVTDILVELMDGAPESTREMLQEAIPELPDNS